MREFLRGAWKPENFLHPFALLLVIGTTILLCAGALVTSTGSGLAVPDWPLSFGTLFPKMEGGVFFEHGHRLIAGTIALCTLAFAAFAHRFASRGVRRLAWIAVTMVFLQALLGGMTVIFKLPTAVSIAHACLAQLFFCTVSVIALVTSHYWVRLSPIPSHQEGNSLRRLGYLLSMAFLFQLLLGATMRHRGAGLAVPDFPTVFGGILPPLLNFSIGIHLAHRMWGFVIFGLAALFGVKCYRQFSSFLHLQSLIGAIVTLVSFQILLGAFTIWLKKPVVLTMLHLVVGASSFATSVVLSVVLAKCLPGNRGDPGKYTTVIPALRARAKITSHLGHRILGPPLNALHSQNPRHIDGYASDFARSDRSNLTPICAPKCEVIFARALRGSLMEQTS